MPYIFPKRFLRTKDILDPVDFQNDFDEPKSLIDEGLDRHNLKSVAFKNLEPDAKKGATESNPYVAQNSYYSFHHTRVECRTRMEYDADVFRDPKTNAGRRTPNFVQPDGITFRDPGISTGTNQGKPYVIPHTGEWSVVQNADLTGPLTVAFSTKSKCNLWLCAYLQYVWQGFFEVKNPWVPIEYEGWKEPFSLKEGGATDTGWAAKFDPEGGGTGDNNLCEAEAAVLNHFGPSMNWTSYPSATDRGGSKVTRAHPYSFALNEMTADVEEAFPGFGGFHHISRGFRPCLVQFALRVNGEIIDESITGKQFSDEESAHGLKVQDGPLYEVTGSDGDRFEYRGQRSHSRNSSYGAALSQALAGQKLRRSRAVAMGPECLPVRIGAVVPIDPGNHTVELVARRISRKKRDFETGDFVGVFSRRLLAMELPVEGLESEETISLFESGRFFKIEPESILVSDSSRAGIDNLQDTEAITFNSIQGSLIRANSLPHTHLPSKIVVSQRKAITTHSTSTANPLDRSGRGAVLTPPTSFSSTARFPGFPRSDTNLNRLTKRSGGPSVAGDSSPTVGLWSNPGADMYGWDFVKDRDSNLSISGSNLSVQSGRTAMLIMADIELLQLNGVASAKATQARMDASTDHTEGAKYSRDYTSFIQDDKYLDLFTYFAIGYRTGDSASTWKIASDFRPGLVNSSNWVNRGPSFSCERGENLEGGAFVSVDETAGGTGASDYGFTILGKDTITDRRGLGTRPSGYGTNIPLMLFIDETTTIKEVAVFTCTTFPTIWDRRHAKYGDEYTTAARQVRVPPSGPTKYVVADWASPVYGRGILDGVEVMWGDCSLSLIKFNL